MAHLIVREPGRIAFGVDLRGPITAGRDADNDLVLADRRVSRRHARIEPGAGGHRAVDLGSTHGMLINGAPATDQPLRDGDVVQLGAVVMVFRDAPIDEEGSIQRTISRVIEPPARADAAEAGRLRVLFDVGRVLGALDDVEHALAQVLDMALGVLACTRGVIALSGGDGPARRIVRGDGEERVIGPAALAAMRDRRESVLVRDRVGDRHAMGAPLEAGERVIGFLYVDDRGRATPFVADDLDFLTALARLAGVAVAQAEERRRLRAVADAVADLGGPSPIVGDSAPMRSLRAQIETCARARDTAILIRGETGTGKELVAAHLHARSPRAGHAFVAVNCAAIPDNLIESELFGHVKGAFSGATTDRRGRFASADGGTLFLDEIADLSLAAQAKLLRVLEEGELQPIGSDRTITVDVRILSATHKDLDAEVAAGRFREDLYYRLDVVTLEVPPLRTRGDDVVALAERFRAELVPRIGRAITGFTDAARAALRAYGWPGNVRQLRNEIERAILLAEGSAIDASDLRLRTRASTTAPPVASSPATLAERWAELDRAAADVATAALTRAAGDRLAAAQLLGADASELDRFAPGSPAAGLTPIEESERAVFAAALREHDGNIQAAARGLGVSRGTLYRKIAKYGLA